jgi:uncharacterized CHY-type Zn-finger protein
MNAEQYLNTALDGNINISTLKPLAWYEIMEGYARHKLAEAQSQADNNHRIAICPECGNSISIRDLEALCQCPHCKVDYPFIIRGNQHPVR